MATPKISNEIKAAAICGAIEILINPEFGTDWILNEVLSDVPDERLGDPEETAEKVEDIINARFKAFALSLLEELPTEQRKRYSEYLSK